MPLRRARERAASRHGRELVLDDLHTAKLFDRSTRSLDLGTHTI